MSETTQNLGLFIYDPVTDGNEYFDVKKAIGDNFKRVDEKLGGQVVEKTLSASAKHGTQTITGGDTPALVFPTIEGRTLINLIGDIGGMESASAWLDYQSTHALDSANKTSGSSGMKVTIATGQTMAAVNVSLTIRAGKYYVFVADVKNKDATSAQISFNTSPVSFSNAVTGTAAFSPAWGKCTSGVDRTNNFNLIVNGVAGQSAYFDSARFYEISAAEYAALDSMTAEQVAARYPYLGTGIHPVQTPAVEVVQDNLLPTFTEWQISQPSTIRSPYEITQTNNGSDIYVDFVIVPVVAGETYTYSIVGNGRHYIQFIDANGNNVSAEWFVSGGKITATAPVNAAKALVVVGNSSTGTHTFTNPVLMPGTTASFKPQRKTTLRVIDELRATPDGSVKDTFRYVDRKTVIVRNLRRMVLDGSLAWRFNLDHAGYKTVAADGIPQAVLASFGIFVKYDGRSLLSTNSFPNINSADWGYINPGSGTTIIVSVADTDSGWGDSYTPTQAEIQAYFNGWKMYEVSGGHTSAYNGTGTKAWVERHLIGTGAGTSDFNAISGKNGWGGSLKPYQLQYQLAQPVIESAQVTGAAVVERGANTVTLSSAGAPVASATLDFDASLYSSLETIARQMSRTLEIADRNDMRDLLYNSGAYVWQRGTAFNNPPQSSYGPDRYKITYATDNNYRVMQSADVPSRMFPLSVRIEGYGSVGGSGALTDITQIVPPEELQNFRGQVITAGWWVKCDPGVTGYVAIYDGKFSRVDISSTSWTLVSTTKLIDPTTITLQIHWRLNRSGLAVGGGMNVIPLGANLGYELRPFQPRKYGEVLAECRRFAYVIGDSGLSAHIGLGTASGSGGAVIGVNFPVKMRVRPSLVANATDWLLADTASTAIAVTSLSIASNASADGMLLNVGSTGLTPFRPYFLVASGNGKTMIFDAEV